MLHDREAIFLATCNATMTTGNVATCRGGVARSQFRFRNSATRLSPAAIFKSAQTKDALWLAHFNKIASQVAIDMSHAATCLPTLRKAEDSSTFLAATQHFCCVAVAKMGCYTKQFFVQPCTATKLRDWQVAGKIASCSIAFIAHTKRAWKSSWSYWRRVWLFEYNAQSVSL